MRLTVENLGPLRQASIDLSKDLIILAGPNNSGKTYLAWSVYGIHEMDAPAQLGPLVAPVMDDMLARREDIFDISLFIRDHGQELAEVIGRAYAKELAADFAAEPERFGKTRFALMFDAGHQLLGGAPSAVALTVHPMTLREHLIQAVTLALVRAVFPVCTIFPAERIATNLFAKELSLSRTELVDQLLELAASPDGVRDGYTSLEYVRQHAQRYPRPIRDSLRMAMDLERFSRAQSEFADLAADMESTIMGGRVTLSEHGQIAFAPQNAPTLRLGVHITASVVKSLSSLVFHLRHRAHKGELLIIDEPELNLHPDNQRKMARLLVKAVNRGLRILISTHSDYLIRELNNLVILAQPGEAIKRTREELGYAENELLAPDKLGVYFFDGTESREVPVDDKGFAIETIEAEIDRLNETSQAIYAALMADE